MNNFKGYTFARLLSGKAVTILATSDEKCYVEIVHNTINGWKFPQWIHQNNLRKF